MSVRIHHTAVTLRVPWPQGYKDGLSELLWAIITSSSAIQDMDHPSAPPTPSPPLSLPQVESCTGSMISLLESYATRPARVAPIAIDFKICVLNLLLSNDTMKWNGSPSQWRYIESSKDSPKLEIDLQGITWKKCQQDVIKHIFHEHPYLMDYVKQAVNRAKTFWFGYIEGNKDYGSHEDLDGVQILDHLQFLDFATQAYDAYKKQIHIRVVREGTPKVSQMWNMCYSTSIKLTHLSLPMPTGLASGPH